jgi:acylphosphatase
VTDAQSYSTAVEGGRPVQLRYTIGGSFDPLSFLNFVAERAAWLSVRGWAAVEGDVVTLVAAGPEALVGALEMAVTLGPDDALVEMIGQHEEVEPVPEGFRVLA